MSVLGRIMAGCGHWSLIFFSFLVTNIDFCRVNVMMMYLNNRYLSLVCSQDDRMSKAKVSDILSEIFKKIGSKENTKEVRSVTESFTSVPLVFTLPF